MSKNDNQRKILIVDDEKDMREILGDRFSAEGFPVLLAGDGKEGLTLAFENHPSAILLDITMPNMDGLQMLEKLRNDNWGKDVPVVLLTNISDTNKIEEVRKIGIQAYMLKAEWKMGQVIDQIKEIIQD